MRAFTWANIFDIIGDVFRLNDKRIADALNLDKSKISRARNHQNVEFDCNAFYDNIFSPEKCVRKGENKLRLLKEIKEAIETRGLRQIMDDEWEKCNDGDQYERFVGLMLGRVNNQPHSVKNSGPEPLPTPLNSTNTESSAMEIEMLYVSGEDDLGSVVCLNDESDLSAIKASGSIVYKCNTNFSFETEFAEDHTFMAKITFNIGDRHFLGFTSVEKWNSKSEVHRLLQEKQSRLVAWFKVRSIEGQDVGVKFLKIGVAND